MFRTILVVLLQIVLCCGAVADPPISKEEKAAAAKANMETLLSGLNEHSSPKLKFKPVDVTASKDANFVDVWTATAVCSGTRVHAVYKLSDGKMRLVAFGFRRPWNGKTERAKFAVYDDLRPLVQAWLAASEKDERHATEVLKRWDETRPHAVKGESQTVCPIDSNLYNFGHSDGSCSFAVNLEYKPGIGPY